MLIKSIVSQCDFRAFDLGGLPRGKLRRSVVPVERKKHLRLPHEKQRLSFTALGIFPIVDLFTFCNFCCCRAVVSSLDQYLQALSIRVHPLETGTVRTLGNL